MDNTQSTSTQANKIKESQSSHNKAREYFNILKENLFRLIDYSETESIVNKSLKTIQEFFNPQKIESIENFDITSIFSDKISSDILKEFALKIKERKKYLCERNNYLKTNILILINSLLGLAYQQNFKEGKIFDNVDDEIRIKSLDQKKIQKFTEGESKDIILNYLDNEKSYAGEVTTEKFQDVTTKKKNGFGYYTNKDKKIAIYGTFLEDEFHQGLLEINKNTFFNGEYMNDNVFKGLFYNCDKDPNRHKRSYYYLIGTACIAENTYEGFYLKFFERSIKIYFGNLKDYKKESKNGLLVDVEILREDFALLNESINLNAEEINFKLFYGDFKDNTPDLNSQDNSFYVYESDQLFKINNNIKVYSLLEINCTNNITTSISQGPVSNKLLNGEGNLLDLGRNIFYKGNFENGIYKGFGTLFYFEDLENPTKLIFIKGKFDVETICEADVYAIRENNLVKIENARLTKDYDLTFGKVIFENNEYYEGSIKNYQKDGLGKYYYSNGSFYHGEWKEDKKHGKGIYIDKDKFKHQGLWENDVYSNIDY